MKRLVITSILIAGIITCFAQNVRTHTVGRGETIETIAKRYEVTVEEIYKLNATAKNVYYTGLVLKIPQKEPKVVVSHSSSPSNNYSSSQSRTNTTSTKKKSSFGSMLGTAILGAIAGAAQPQYRPSMPGTYTGNMDYLLDPRYAMMQTQQKFDQINYETQQAAKQAANYINNQLQTPMWIPDPSTVPMTYVGGTADGIGESPSTISGSNTTSKESSTINTRRMCSLCNGTGKIVKHLSPPMFGTQDYKVRCNECGEYWLKSSGHTHLPCTLCHGKKYLN